MIAAAAFIFAGCAGNDTFKRDLRENTGESSGAIGFTSFTEKVTKAENSDALYSWSFYDHQETFQVWARKNNQPTKEIFEGDTVFVEKEGNVYKYKYAPDRYWDKLADKYNFYAAAPAPAEGAAWKWKFNAGGITNAETIDKGYFTIEENKFALNGVNLQSVDNGKPSAALRNTFKTATNNSIKDVDLLIADETPVARSFYNKANPEAVNLNFIHILSKLNITISTSLDEKGNNAHKVDLLAFEVKNIPNTGNFNENSKDLSTGKKQIRWTLDSETTPSRVDIPTGINAYDATTYTIDNDKKVSVPYTNAVAPNPVSQATKSGKKYIVESLIIPQEIKYERVALDGGDHPAVTDATPLPYASYEAYEAAKHNDGVTRLTEAQFNALINGTAFISWANYDHTSVPGETDERIDETTFDSRVTEATKEVSVPYTDYTAYSEAKSGNPTLTEEQFNALINNGAFISWDDYKTNVAEIEEDAFNALVTEATKEVVEKPYADFDEYKQAKGNNAVLTEAQFNALINGDAFVQFADYNHELVPGENDNRIDKTEFERRVAEAAEKPVTHILAYAAPTEPYFTITYSIDGQVFSGTYNLAAAFLGKTNNETVTEDETVKAWEGTFSFYEGWQNTLNIIINPAAIKFTADIAEWSDNTEVSYEIEKGNE